MNTFSLAFFILKFDSLWSQLEIRRVSGHNNQPYGN